MRRLIGCFAAVVLAPFAVPVSALASPKQLEGFKTLCRRCQGGREGEVVIYSPGSGDAQAAAARPFLKSRTEFRRGWDKITGLR